MWWIILGVPNRPFPVLDCPGIPDPWQFVASASPLAVSILSKPSLSHAVSRVLLPVCVALPSHHCWWLHEFWHQHWWEAIRYLQDFHSVLPAIQPFVLLPVSHRVSFQALFYIDWSQLSHHLLLNQFPVSFFHCSILPVFCPRPTYLNCTHAFLRSCAQGRCYLVRQNWFNCSQGSDGAYSISYLWYKLQHWQATECHVILQWAEGLNI